MLYVFFILFISDIIMIYYDISVYILLLYVFYYLYTYYLDLAILHPTTGEGTFDILPEIVILTCGTYGGGWPVPPSFLLHPTELIHTQS